MTALNLADFTLHLAQSYKEIVFQFEPMNMSHKGTKVTKFTTN